MIVTSSDEIVIAGSYYHGHVIKFDFDGNIIWHKRYYDGIYYFKDINATSDNGFIITGYSIHGKMIMKDC